MSEQVVPQHYLDVIEPLEGIKTMLEFGNKRGIDSKPYKPYFEARGIKHTSVDLNGLDGALPLDLREPLNLGRFDMVTNIGTIEHVDRQEPAWRNLVEACANVLVSISPAPHDWPGHGLFYPGGGFYESLALRNGFKLEKLFRAGRPAVLGRDFIFARMHRVAEKAWRMPEKHWLHPAPPSTKKRGG